MSPAGRQNARLLGLRAEWLAAALLTLKGYRILARNFSVPGGEIDIIAFKGRTVAFVEVKARATLDQGREAIDATKRRRMSRAAANWVAGHAWASTCTLRGDAIFIAPGHWPRHEVNVVELAMW